MDSFYIVWLKKKNFQGPCQSYTEDVTHKTFVSVVVKRVILAYSTMNNRWENSLSVI